MDRTKIFACLIAVALSSGCSTRNTIVVGSKNFTEQLVLGEIVAQHIEQKLHTRVERKLDLGGTLLTQRALTSGQIDLYPEYTGTAYTNVLKHQSVGDPAAVLKTVQSEYESRFHLRWLAPLGFNDSFAMVIRGDDARARHLKTLSEAAGYAPGWTLGAGYEFLGRPDGYKSLMKSYSGFRWTGSPKSMDLGLLYQALKQQQVSMVAGNTTDGVLSALDAVVLEDDRHAFPPYQASIVVREDALTRFPGLETALNDLSGKISESTMRRLNYEVDSKHRPVRVVAGEFLSGMNASVSSGQRRCAGAPFATNVRADVSYPNLFRALYDIGADSNVCIGIEVSDPAMFTTPVKTDRNSGTAKQVIGKLVGSFPGRGYCLSARYRLLLVSPCKSRPNTWLDLRIPEIKWDKSFLQSISNGLYLSMLNAVAPVKSGYVGDFRSGVMQDIIGPYNLRNYSVRELLNRFVGDSQGAFWATTKPYFRKTHTSPAPQRFWTIIEYRDRPADVQWQLQHIEQTAPAAFR